jgi:ER-bound oxygenase mpaB/B'/Rubber oxygenase, catalytic domain
MRRDHWLRRIEQLDPERDFEEIYRISCAYEFPWDTTRALELALFRTYAVPSIGGLLGRTGEFVQRAQKRYDDTTLILDAAIEHGMGSAEGRTGIRRMNQMHRMYEISNEDFLYVLSVLVVVPKRWLDDYGWRRYSPTEVRAAANYYRALGRRMNIKDVPGDYEGFERYLDAYERRHFGYDEGGRAVSDASLDMMATWYPSVLGPLMRRASVCLMDTPLREALHYSAPPPALQRAVRSGMRLRARVMRLLPPRRRPHFFRQNSNIRGYPNGYRVADLGIFPTPCPVPHATPTPGGTTAAR